MLLLTILFVIIGSLLEINALLANTYDAAYLYYKMASIFYTFTYLSLSVFIVYQIKSNVRDPSLLIVASLFTLELVETIRYDFKIIFKDNFWVLVRARSFIAYLARTIELLYVMIIFAILLFVYSKRTKLFGRKILSIMILVTLLFSIGANTILFIITYPNVNQIVSALTLIPSTFSVLFIIAYDPYFFVFWQGEIYQILVYRDDGILLFDIHLKEGIRHQTLLISTFLTAITEFGSELLFGKERLKHITFGETIITLFPYKSLYMAIIGKNVSEKISKFAKIFLQKVYQRFEPVIESALVEIPDKKMVEEVFMEELGKVIL